MVPEVQAHIVLQHLDVNITPRAGDQREPSVAVDPSNDSHLLMATIDADLDRLLVVDQQWSILVELY